MTDNAAPVLILTRPAGAAARLRAEMGDALAGLRIIDSPVLRIEALAPVPPPGAFSGLILTSENGADAAARLGLLPGGPVWAVGARTAEVARAHGFAPRTAAGEAESLIALILSQRPGGRLLHIRGRHARGEVAARLTAAGAPAVELVAYDQTALPLTAAALVALGGTGPVILPLYSPRTAALIAAQGPFTAPLHVAAISPAAAQGFTGAATLTIAARPEGPWMRDALAAAIGHARAAAHRVEKDAGRH